MFFAVSCVVFLCLTSVAGQTGVFEPYSFTAASCSGVSQWSMWFDTNDPSAGKGDFEITSHIQQLFPTFICSAPSAIEAQTSIDTNPTSTGDVFRITVKDGFMCLNQQVNLFKNKICADYKVRYCCPV